MPGAETRPPADPSAVRWAPSGSARADVAGLGDRGEPRMLDAIARLIDAQSTPITPEDLVDLTVNGALAAYDPIGGVLVTAEGGAVRTVTTTGAVGPTIAAIGPLHVSRRLPIMEALRTGEAVWVPSAAATKTDFPELEAAAAGRADAWAAVPLVSRGAVIGVLGLAFAEPHSFEGHDRAGISAVAALLALALARWQSAADPHPIEIAVLDERGVLVDVNDAWRRFAVANGGTEATGLGVSYLDVCERAGDPDSLAVASAIRRALRGDTLGLPPITVPCHAPGQRRWFDVVVSSRIGASGVVCGATVMLLPSARPPELTATEVGEEHHVVRLLDQIRSAVLVLDTVTRRFVYANDAASELTGYERRHLFEIDLADLGWVANGKEDGRIWTEGASTFTEVELVRLDGRRLPVEVHAGIPDDCGHVILVVTDVTTRSEQDKARTDAASLRVLLDDRERVARDLHDGVVQEVFGTAMALAAMSPLLSPELQQRVEELIDVQDAIVRRIRTTVFALTRSRSSPTAGLRAALTETAEAVERSLGFVPDLALSGPIDALHDDLLAEHLVLAFREVLSNVARHAQARHVRAAVSVTEREVELLVVDDGVGFDPEDVHRGSGLSNLDHRARSLGGRCDVTSGANQGTVVRWVAPRARAGGIRQAENAIT